MSFIDTLFGKKNPVKTTFGDMDKVANDYMNPFSNNNQKVFGSLTNQATDIAAQQNIGNQQSMAMGFNPFANQQNRDLSAQITKQAGGGWNEWLSSANNIGANMIGQRAQMQLQKDMANAGYNQQRQQQIGGFMGQLLGQAAQMALPGVGGAIGHAAGKIGGGVV